MLAIRMQRTGRKGHAQFRVIVQDAHRSPSSGKIVAQIGHYDPHSKQTILDKEKAAFYLKNGAQPSPRVVNILKSEKVKLPEWVMAADKKKGEIRNPDKLRRNRPAEPEAPAEKPAEPAAETTEAPAEAEPAEETVPVAEASDETPASEEPSADTPESAKE